MKPADAAIRDVTDMILALMKRQGVSQRELARRMGCSQPNIALLLTGSKNMQLRTIADVLTCLGYELRVAAKKSSKG